MKGRKSEILAIGLAVIVIAALQVARWFNPGRVIYRDRNQNGIWDDIEPYIEKNSVNQYHRLALEMYFKGLQAILLDPTIGTKEKDPKYSSLHDRGFACLYKVSAKFHFQVHMNELRDVIVNDRAREVAYEQYAANLSGGALSLWDEKKQGNPCDFELP